MTAPPYPASPTVLLIHHQQGSKVGAAQIAGTNSNLPKARRSLTNQIAPMEKVQHCNDFAFRGSIEVCTVWEQQQKRATFTAVQDRVADVEKRQQEQARLKPKQCIWAFAALQCSVVEKPAHSKPKQRFQMDFSCQHISLLPSPNQSFCWSSIGIKMLG